MRMLWLSGTMSLMTVFVLGMATLSTKSEPENFYFDTLSAHIAVSGLASGQRWLYVLANKDVEDLTEEEKRKLEFRPKWAEEGSTNSLVNVYNFHVAAVRDYFGQEDVHWMKDADKEIRDVFVKATHISQLAQRRDLIKLCSRRRLLHCGTLPSPMAEVQRRNAK